LDSRRPDATGFSFTVPERARAAPAT